MNVIPGPVDRRIAVMSTPRVGNAWLRTILNKFLGAETAAFHHPRDIPWEELSGGFVMQLHWPPTDELVAKLRDNRFSIVTLARHPADVLLSILQYSQRAAETHRWLGGSGGDEAVLRGADPSTEAFRSYVRSQRARDLLSLSPTWSAVEGCRLVRYEDLVRDPLEHIEALGASFGLAPSHRAAIAVSASGVRSAHSSGASHSRQGRPGSWRNLLSADVAREIATVHHEALALGAYDVQGASSELTDEAIRDRWSRLRLSSDEEELDALRRDLDVYHERTAAYQQLLDVEPVQYVLRQGLGLRSVMVAGMLKRAVDRIRP